MEPEAALKQRFGFNSFRAATHWVSAVLEQTWGLTALECSRMAISDQNAIVWVASDRGGLVVKWSRDTDRFPKLEASTRLLSALAGQGCARSVANHFPERIGPGNTGRAFVRSVVHRTAGVGGRLVGRAGPRGGPFGRSMSGRNTPNARRHPCRRIGILVAQHRVEGAHRWLAREFRPRVRA